LVPLHHDSRPGRPKSLLVSEAEAMLCHRGLAAPPLAARMVDEVMERLT
jgi:hypothetical protein